MPVTPRVILASIFILAGLVVEALLINATIYWLWVVGFFPRSDGRDLANAGLSSLGCLLVAISQVAVAWWLLLRPSHEAARRRRLGLCRECGYDLTGNASGRCPECGAPIPTSRSAQDHAA